MNRIIKDLIFVTSLLVMVEGLCHGASWSKSYEHLNILTTSQVSSGGQLFVKHCLKNGINLVDKETGFSLLHVAAAEGRVEDIVLLLEKGADCDMQTLFGETPLYLAVDGGYIEVVRTLIERGADPDFVYRKQNGDEVTVIIDAVIEGDMAMVSLLISLGANLDSSFKNSRGNGMPLLGLAILSGRQEMVQLLLDHGVNVNYIMNANKTPLTFLDLANRSMKVEITEILKNAGVLTSDEIKSLSPKEFSIYKDRYLD